MNDQDLLFSWSCYVCNLLLLLALNPILLKFLVSILCTLCTFVVVLMFFHYSLGNFCSLRFTALFFVFLNFFFIFAIIIFFVPILASYNHTKTHILLFSWYPILRELIKLWLLFVVVANFWCCWIFLKPICCMIVWFWY